MRLIFSFTLMLGMVTLIASEPSSQTVRVCVSPNSMPIESIEQGKHIGMARDFLVLIAERSDLEFELVPTRTWTESVVFAKERRCDILSAADNSDELEAYFHFTEPLMNFPIVITAKEGIPFVSSLESIKEKRISTIASAEYIEVLKKRYPDMRLKEMPSTKIGLQSVLEGKVDYFLDITAELAYTTRKYSIHGINIVGFTGDDFNYRVAVRNDDPVLFEKIQSIVQNIKQEETQHIFNKWIDAEVQTVHNYSLIFKIIFMSILGYVLFYFWNRKLTKEINKRQEIQNQLNELNSSLENEIKLQVSQMRESDIFLHQQSRLAQIGELLSNIAHQWRQPISRLSSLFMQAELQLKHGTLDEDKIMSLIEKNNSIVEHMSQTIDDFTHFFQQDSTDKVYFNPIEPCKEAMGIIEGTLGESSIMLNKNCPKDISKIHGHPRAFSHVILILLTNAGDVLRERAVDQPEIWIEMTQDNESLNVSVEDNGGGIADELLLKVFDPYFTTKSKNEGTGIGLYMASTMIQRIFQGTITVSNSYKGAKFMVKIPLIS